MGNVLGAIGPLAFLFVMAVARADLLESDESKDSLPDQPSTIDEVTVVERKGIRQLRFELVKADDRVFDLYNALNSNDALDVICKKETRIESQIKYRVCKSAYHRQLDSESSSDLLMGDDPLVSEKPSASHYSEVRSNMANLMTKHPKLLQAVQRRAALRKAISAQKENDER